MQNSTAGKSIQPSQLTTASLTQDEPETSASLSKSLALQLLDLMKKVTAPEVTPSTVNAACLCASEIHKILKLNFEMKRHET
jgi:hypothetical protein